MKAAAKVLSTRKRPAENRGEVYPIILLDYI